MGGFEVKNNIDLTVTVCIASFEAIGELQREKLRQSRAVEFMDERVDNSCKRKAEYLCRFLVIIHTEGDEWQASLIREKSACLAKVSVTEQILRKFPNAQGTEHTQHSVYQALFLRPRTRAWERD